MSPEEAREIVKRMNDVERKLDALITKIEGVQADVAETKEIVAAWKSVKLMGTFLKWAAGLVTAGGIVFGIMKGWIHK